MDGYTPEDFDELMSGLKFEYEQFVTSEYYYEVLNVLEKLHFCIWIGKTNMYVRKMEVTLNLEEFHPVPEITLDFLFRTEQQLSEYNESIEILAPSESTPLLSLFQDIMMTSLNDSKEKANEASVRANLNVIAPQSMVYYDDNGSFNQAQSSTNDCTVGMFMDVKIIDALLKAEESGEDAPYCTIAADGESFAVSVPFIDGFDSWCIGYSKEEDYISGYGDAVGGGVNTAHCVLVSDLVSQ